MRMTLQADFITFMRAVLPPKVCKGEGSLIISQRHLGDVLVITLCLTNQHARE